MVVEMIGLSKSYGSLKVIEQLDIRVERGERLVISGVNGSGKSTLMRIIAGIDADYEGNFRSGTGIQIGYFSQELDTLNPRNKVIDEVEGIAPTHLLPSLRNLLGAFLFRGDDVFKYISILSGGEKSRLALVKLLLQPANLLVLDEPTNHLDMASKSVLMKALKAFAGTLIFVSHDRYFIEALATQVLELKTGGWKVFPGDYRYYLVSTEKEAESANAHASGVEAQSEGRMLHSSQKQIRGQIQRLKREERKIMSRLEDLEGEHQQLIGKMSDESIYTDGDKIRYTKARVEENEALQAALSKRWHEIDTELKEAESFAAGDT